MKIHNNVFTFQNTFSLLFLLFLFFTANSNLRSDDNHDCHPTKITSIIEMVSIPAGTFVMGSPTTEPERNGVEVQHQVTLSAFKMSKYEITFAQYDAFCDATGRNKPSDAGWGRGNRPVINVSWDDAVAFCGWLSTQTGKTYRLPTEAEWEYACRAGTTTPFNTGPCLSNTDANYRWDYPYSGCSNSSTNCHWKTLPVGSYSANAWGLYDMHGNVWEWCSDWYGGYPTTAVTNPTGPATGSNRVCRGGSWYSWARNCRGSDRSYTYPSISSYIIGFRVVSE